MLSFDEPNTGLNRPGLFIFTSNRLEILAQQLARIVKTPLSSPLSPETIVVHSRGMERWVSMEIARHNGVCANCEFPFPNTFLNNMFGNLVPDLPEASPFEAGTMTFKIMKILPSIIKKQEFETLKTYLKDDLNNLKLFQLSEKIADLFDQYLVFRPEMIFRWEEGKEVYWQAHLWREIAGEDKNLHRARLRKTLLETIKMQQEKIKNISRRISIFGISHLPLFHLEVFAKLSSLIQINLFFMNPCREYWADIVSDRQTKQIKQKFSETEDISDMLHLEKGNSLLASMGRIGKEFFSMICDSDCEIEDRFEDQQGVDLLSRIQSDILDLRDRAENGLVTQFDQNDRNQMTGPLSSIQVHSCHSPMREIEVLHDNLLAMFEVDAELLPNDIIVMTPDIELYAPFFHAVFDAQIDENLRIPYTIADLSVRRESRVVDGFLSLIDLKDSRFGVTSVLAVLEFPAVREKFGLKESDIAIVEHWINETRIRWGIDEESRIKLGLPGVADNTWKAGIERLLLGYAMPGFKKEMVSGILPYDHIEGSDTKILGKLLEFLKSVFDCIEILNHPRTLSRWNKILTEILENFFAPDEDAEREIQVLRHILDNLSEKEAVSGFDQKVELEVVRSYLGNHLERESLGSGFISAGVTFCAMLPMRSIPAKVIYLVGMNNDAFPRKNRPLGFDLIAKHPRPGDRSRRNDDKYLFLESIISARKRLYISYAGQSIQDNTDIPPSVLVSELIDYIKDGFGLSEDELITKHRLQAFSPEYFKENTNLLSYSRENFVASGSIFHRAVDQDSVPVFISKKLSTPPPEYKTLEMDTLSAFFGNPARFLLQNRLGIFLEDRALISDERENFNLDPLSTYGIGQDLFQERLSGSDLKDFLPRQRATGQLPHGNVGDVFYRELSLDADSFVNKIENFSNGKLLPEQGVEMEIMGFSLNGRLSQIYEHGLVRVRYAKTKSKDLLNSWIYHLVFCSSIATQSPMTSFLVCKDAAWKFDFAYDCKDILKNLLTLYWHGLSEPLHFFPESSREYAEKALIKQISKEKALTDARKKWLGSDFIRGESEDPYYDRCFSREDPLDETFQHNSETVYRPLLTHCTKINF